MAFHAASLRRGETPGMAWTTTAGHRAWSAPVVQSAAELSAVGGVLLQDSPRGFVRQQVIAMVSWPRPGRGASVQPSRVLLHHPAEEPVSGQVLAQAAAGVEVEAAVERTVRQLRCEGWSPSVDTDSLRPGSHPSMLGPQ
eukprot:6904759-Alexandrium_andersonii.AAC.1